MNQSNETSKTRVLVECALLIALASVLCVFPKFKFLAYGGSITLCSMLPIIVISYRRGLKWGFLSSTVFAVVQILTGLVVTGVSMFSALGGVALDYFLAYGVIGIGGVFRGKFKHRGTELALGSFVALFLRYIFHFLSGYILWGEWARDFFESVGAWGESIIASVSGNMLAVVYSIVYNGLYMIPEIVLTVIASFLIAKYVLYKLETPAKTST